MLLCLVIVGTCERTRSWLCPPTKARVSRTCPRCLKKDPPQNIWQRHGGIRVGGVGRGTYGGGRRSLETPCSRQGRRSAGPDTCRLTAASIGSSTHGMLTNMGMHASGSFRGGKKKRKGRISKGGEKRGERRHALHLAAGDRDRVVADRDHRPLDQNVAAGIWVNPVGVPGAVGRRDVDVVDVDAVAAERGQRPERRVLQVDLR